MRAFGNRPGGAGSRLPMSKTEFDLVWALVNPAARDVEITPTGLRAAWNLSFEEANTIEMLPILLFLSRTIHPL